jgi:EpsD family peptidyl-prolyl cis-trans isomerase
MPNALHFRRASRPAINNRLFFLSGLIGIAIALSACGRADGQKAASQVAAKVNGGEITVHQINSVIAGSNRIPPDEAKQAAAQTLERIIDQELLVQKALKDKLDRDPQVMQSIEDAKRQILARAYIERAAAGSSTESREEIRKFYQENPALFERRRIYRVHELVVVAPREKLDTLKAATAGAKSLQDVAGWLKSQKLAFQVAMSNRPAEQIPLEILPRVSEMREGQIAVIPTSRGASVVQLLQAQEASLSEQQATPIIEQYLHSRKQLAVAQAEVRKLRQQARIEYVGEFEAPRAQPASSNAAPSGVDDRDEPIRKGLAGLR